MISDVFTYIIKIFIENLPFVIVQYQKITIIGEINFNILWRKLFKAKLVNEYDLSNLLKVLVNQIYAKLLQIKYQKNFDRKSLN